MQKTRLLTLLLSGLILASCASRKLEKDYKVVDASHQDIPEWVTDLDEWLDDDETDFEKYRYYIYETEAKNSRATACEIAKARSAANVAAEVSTFIKQSFAQSKSGDPTKLNQKLAEYVQDDLAKEVQAFIVGAQNYKTYWEKRKFLKDEGAQADAEGFVCTSLVKISKENLKKAFTRSEEALAKKSDEKTKESVQKILKDASDAYTKI